jgi:N-acetylneuraminic acid mutarotase
MYKKTMKTIFVPLVLMCITNLCIALSNACPNVSEEVVVYEDVSLPSERTSVSAVWDGTDAYIFGGECKNSVLTDIVRYTPSDTSIEILTARLPVGIADAAAVWTGGTNAYLFGGRSDVGVLDCIINFDPNTDAIKIMTAKLPSPRKCASAAWNDKNVYIFGGYNQDGELLDEIVRYNPSTDRITVMGAKLPYKVAETSAIWHGKYAYIFGGKTSNGKVLNKIIRYDPYTDTITVMSAELPAPRYDTAVVHAGCRIYIFGGYSYMNTHISKLDEIVRYEPETDRIVVMESSLPTPIIGYAVWGGECAYIFNGENGNIIKYIPAEKQSENQNWLKDFALTIVICVEAIVIVVLLRVIADYKLHQK